MLLPSLLRNRALPRTTLRCRSTSSSMRPRCSSGKSNGGAARGLSRRQKDVRGDDEHVGVAAAWPDRAVTTIMQDDLLLAKTTTYNEGRQLGARAEPRVAGGAARLQPLLLLLRSSH